MRPAPVLAPWGQEWPSGVPFPAQVVDGNVRFVHLKVGQRHAPWAPVARLAGVVVERTKEGLLVHAPRSLLGLREVDGHYAGWVSIGGVRRRAFTGSVLFRVDGQLVQVECLNVAQVRE